MDVSSSDKLSTISFPKGERSHLKKSKQKKQALDGGTSAYTFILFLVPESVFKLISAGRI